MKEIYIHDTHDDDVDDKKDLLNFHLSGDGIESNVYGWGGKIATTRIT
jgi:hypothetical protein